MLLLCILVGASCSYDDGYFFRKIKELDELAAKGGGRAKEQIESKKYELLEAFKKLPQGDARKDALDKLGRRAREVITEAEQILAAVAKEREKEGKAAIEEYKKKFVGRWEGGDMKLRISPAGMVNYERNKGAGKRSVNAFLSEFHRDHFKVGFMGINTTFRIDKAPYQDGDKWKMKIDGVELTRVGDGSRFGTWVCSEYKEDFCRNPTTEFVSTVPEIHLLHVTPKVPEKGQQFVITWIAEDVGQAAPPNHKLAETPLTYDGENQKAAAHYTIHGHLTRPTKGWPTGRYRVEILSKGAAVAEAKFQIAAADEAKTGQPTTTDKTEKAEAK